MGVLHLAHPPLVSDAGFLRVQQTTALATPDDGNHHRYHLTGLIICGLCGRRAEGHWAHGRARYRCRHGHTSASDAQPERPRTLYIREDQLVDQALVEAMRLRGKARSNAATDTADGAGGIASKVIPARYRP